MTTATLNATATCLEDYISNYRQRILDGDKNTLKLNLTKDELNTFVYSSDFRLLCEIFYGTKDFCDNNVEDIYESPVPDKNVGIKHPKSKGIGINDFESFYELIEYKYTKNKKDTKLLYSDNNSIIDIDIKKVKFEDSQVNFNFLKAIFPSLHEKDVNDIRDKTITCIKYFSALFELYAQAPYLLKTEKTEDGRTRDSEVIDVAKIMSKDLTLKRFKEICTYFYQDDSMRDEFTITELFKNWSYYSKKSNRT